jgi:hypothetical protein
MKMFFFKSKKPAWQSKQHAAWEKIKAMAHFDSAQCDMSFIFWLASA